MTLDIRKLEKVKRVPPTQEEELLAEAVNLIQYFVNRVEEGSIRSKVTYEKYKQFLRNYENYLL